MVALLFTYPNCHRAVRHQLNCWLDRSVASDGCHTGIARAEFGIQHLRTYRPEIVNIPWEKIVEIMFLYAWYLVTSLSISTSSFNLPHKCKGWGKGTWVNVRKSRTNSFTVDWSMPLLSTCRVVKIDRQYSLRGLGSGRQFYSSTETKSLLPLSNLQPILFFCRR